MSDQMRPDPFGFEVGRGRFEEAGRLLASLPSARRERPVGLVEVEDERITLALMSRNAAGKPDLEMPITGITGTNGKTTTSHLLASMLEAAGTRCGLVGTVEYRLGGEVLRAGRTTPEAADLCPYLRRMRDAGADACVMEVSSHALDLRRQLAVRGEQRDACAATPLQDRERLLSMHDDPHARYPLR